MSLIYYADLAGVFVFAVSGALRATNKKMDLFGIIVLATVTAIGGGTLRDVLLDQGGPFWMSDPTYLYVCVTGAVLTMFVPRPGQTWRRTLWIADAFGLALFTVLGAQKALLAGTSATIAVVMGMLTGIAGGIVRDQLAGEVPLVLRQEIYATAALAGGVAFVGLNKFGVENAIALTVGFAVTLSLRLAAIRYRLSLPSIDGGDDPSGQVQ